MAACEPDSSLKTVEIQKVAIVKMATAPAIGWTSFFMAGPMNRVNVILQHI